MENLEPVRLAAKIKLQSAHTVPELVDRGAVLIQELLEPVRAENRNGELIEVVRQGLFVTVVAGEHANFVVFYAGVIDVESGKTLLVNGNDLSVAHCLKARRLFGVLVRVPRERLVNRGAHLRGGHDDTKDD
ncbi:hypothetical protein SDC9_200620 [bioreactor metagenome]|uniref:Uncharacterized protein n=1 Tax=bioreactor metagenome TaxID=1076179 RepID=A0A645INZ1_9ZZZZ